MLPEIVIVVSETHWQCVSCKLNNKRIVSLDEHLKQNHPYTHQPCQKVSRVVNPAPLEGAEFENTKKIRHMQRRSVVKNQKAFPLTNHWMRNQDFGDSSDGADDIDNDDENDSDFVPSELENKPAKPPARNTRKTLRKQPKKDIVKRVRLKHPRKEEQLAATKPDSVIDSEPDPVSEYQPATEPEQEVEAARLILRLPQGKGSEDFRISFKSKTKQGEKNEQIVEGQLPKKRGRPPKPKPEPVEGEELPPKRPYRKRIPDPSELLLKLRNVGRKPNTRIKTSADEKVGIKNMYVRVLSKGNPIVNASEQNGHTQGQVGNISFSDDDTEQTRHLLNISQDSRSSQDTTSSTSQTEQFTRERVRCKTCLCLFTSEKLLQEHLTKVSVDDVVQCSACEMKFHGLIDLNMHVFCDHEYEKQPLCFLCKDNFKSMEKLEKHLHRQHRGKPDCKLADTRFHDCRLCRMELNIDFQLIKNHYYRRHKAYVCPECYGKDVELLFYTDTYLYGEHKQMHAKSPAECTICRMVFPTAREMKTHMWTHASDNTEDGTGGKCNKCDKWLPNSGAMLMHEKEHKNEAIRKNYALEASIGFPCMKCEHIFSSKSNLKKHACKADPNRAFYFHCEYCAHGCNTKEQLRDHIALHHLGIKRYSCDYCDQRFVCAPTLRRHVRRAHTKEKPYACHLCKERFYERNLMLRHVSKHTGIASFKCELCGKGFHTKFDLKKHAENHTDSRDFVCLNCGLDYKRSYHLKRHLEKGCKKNISSNSVDENSGSVASEAPLEASEDADEMVFIDLAEEDLEMSNDNDTDLDNYNDESSGPDYADDGDGDDEVI